jgi:hypothetical protein
MYVAYPAHGKLAGGLVLALQGQRVAYVKAGGYKRKYNQGI